MCLSVSKGWSERNLFLQAAFLFCILWLFSRSIINFSSFLYFIIKLVIYLQILHTTHTHRNIRSDWKLSLIYCIVSLLCVALFGPESSHERAARLKKLREFLQCAYIFFNLYNNTGIHTNKLEAGVHKNALNWNVQSSRHCLMYEISVGSPLNAK